jgi:phosphomannomutase
MTLRELKIGPAGVRGVVGEALAPELVVDFACAFGTWCGSGPIAIGRDTRRSSTAFRAAVVSGLLSTGRRVLDLGVVSSPLLSFGIREIGAAGGIAITGSHNDSRWNALKFFGPDGALLNAAKGGELLDVYRGASFERATWDRFSPVDTADVSDRYLEHLSSLLDVDAIRACGFRIAVDLANGTCGAIATRFLQSLRCTVLPMNDEPTGSFGRAPAPTSASMRDLAAVTRDADAALGAALNVDGDRVGFVTAEGATLSEELSLPLAAVSRLRRRPGAIVTSYSTSGITQTLAHRYGQRVVRGPVGEGQIVDLGLAEGAVLAGEGSGGVAVLPASVAYDGLLTLGLVLDELASSRRTLAQVVDTLPVATICKRELRCPPNLVYRVIDRFRRRHAHEYPDCADGVRLAWVDAWLHVRASATEPLLRIIAEAPTRQRAEELVEGVVSFAQSIVGGPEGRSQA